MLVKGDPGDENGKFQANHVSNILEYKLATQGTRAPVALILNIQDKRVLTSFEEGFITIGRKHNLMFLK